MAYLLDSNIFLRLIEGNDPLRPTVLDALRLLRIRREELCYTSQIVAEVWNVCTRPTSARGGFGLSVSQTERKIRLMERHFRFLPDSLATHQEWRQLLIARSVSGVQVHDARIAAAIRVYGVSHLLTFNTRDFSRFSGFVIVTPNDVLATP
jgi:predicted nucleic acid-binding protein